MYQAAGKTGKKVQTCLRRLTFITPSGIKPHAFFFNFNFRPGWWYVGGQYNRTFSRIIYMKIGFSSRRTEMLLFLTLIQHQHDRRDVTSKRP